MKKEESKIYKIKITLILLVFIGLIVEIFWAIYGFDKAFLGINSIICFLLGICLGFNLFKVIS